MKTRLTNQKHWDDYWNSIDLPSEVQKSPDNLLLNEELKIFDRFLPKKSLSVLEIGGAPGQYLAYMYKQYGYDIHSLDYSPAGCRKTIENFKLLDIPVTIYERDVFSDLSDLPLFDIVFSMGLIEHFENVSEIVKKHTDLLKANGILILGLPNFRGINRFFLKRLAPKMLSQHNLDTMDISSWNLFEEELNLKRLFRAYVGGFEPATFLLKENPSLINNFFYLNAKILNKLFHRNFSSLRKYNSKHISGYILGIFRKQ
jgi:SAM-dependent methyltransferase